MSGVTEVLTTLPQKVKQIQQLVENEDLLEAFGGFFGLFKLKTPIYFQIFRILAV